MSLELTCEKCDYTWSYGGEMPRATCPSCGGKVETGIPINDEENDVIEGSPSPEERMAVAQERMADALERIAEGVE